MTLKQLKASLVKFGNDNENNHVIILTIDDKGDKKYGLLTGIAMVINLNAIIFADEEATKRLQEETLTKDENKT